MLGYFLSVFLTALLGDALLLCHYLAPGDTKVRPGEK